MPFVGEAVCLLTALLWAVAVSMFRGPVLQHGARTVNLVKLLLGATLQGLTVWALGQGHALRAAPGHALLLLAASGLIGLTVGDTALFATVARLGVHRTLLLQTLAPVFAALIAWVWRDELPTTLEMTGAAVILAGVAFVVAPRRGQLAVVPVPDGVTIPVSHPAPGETASILTGGVMLGVLAAVGQGAGVALAKAGMAEVAVVPASFVRLAVAAVGLALLAVTRRRLAQLRRLVVAPVMVARVVPATLLGTYLALFLMMLGIALAPAAIAATLLSVSPVYGLFIDSFVHRQPVTARGLTGTLLAVAGVAILTHG
jgi:drug/metabolite transporter (DMT)-like permease